MTDAVWRRQHAVVEQMMRALMDCPVPVIAAVTVPPSPAAWSWRGVRFRLRGAVGAVRADRGDTGHHAGRRRHAEPAARGRRAPRQGDRPDGRAVHGRGGARLGHGQQGVRRDRLMAEVRAVALRIAANAPVSVRQAKKAIDKADRARPHVGLCLRDRGLQPHGRHRGPPKASMASMRSEAANTKGGSRDLDARRRLGQAERRPNTLMRRRSRRVIADARPNLRGSGVTDARSFRLSDHTRWPAKHPDRLQLYSLPTPNGVKVSIMLEEIGLPYEAHASTSARTRPGRPNFCR